MPIILLSGQQFSYLVERKSIRSLRLRLKSIDSFVISCPRLTPNFIISKFINEHADWIIHHTRHYQTAVKLSELTTLTILDNPYQIITTKTKTDSVVIYQEEQKIYTNTISISTTHLQSLYNRKLRPLAIKLIKQELKNLSTQFDFHHGLVSVRNQTSRFGSCSFHGNLSFNWQIIFFPKAIFRHILLHELTHLAIKDHSIKFWHQLSVYDPNSKENNHWLKKEPSKYMIFNS